MASSWADEMADEAAMPALNFTAMLDEAQAAARNGLSSGDEDTAATPGQRREGSRARAADRAAPDIRPASPAAATSSSTRPALQARERQFDQRDAPPPPFSARSNPRPVVPIPVEDQAPHAWPVEHGSRVANGLHDIADIRQGDNERPIEVDWRQEEHALPWAPVPARGFHQRPAHDRHNQAYVAPGGRGGQGPHAGQVHLVDQHFEPAEFLLEFQEAIRNFVARGVETHPTPAQRFEVKERFTGLITHGAGQQALLVKHLEPVLRQLIANQMFGLQVFQMLAAGVFIESTLCPEVAALYSSLFKTRRKRGLLDGFPVLLALQDLVDAYRDSRSAATMERDKNNIKSWPEGGSSVAMARQFFQEFFAREQLTEQETRHEHDTAHRYVATLPDQYSKFVRQSAPSWVVAIHNGATPGSLNDYETNWGSYDRLQPADTKRHLGLKTGLQGRVHTLPSWREDTHQGAGVSAVHGMVDKEEVRALLERQDISGLHQLISRVPALPQYQHEGMTLTDHDYALYRQQLGDRTPMASLHALPQRRCFRCDKLMLGVGGHGISDCKYPPSVQELAGLDRSIWDTRWEGAGPAGKEAFLAKEAGRQLGAVPGATYVTTASSHPYTRPGVPRPVHVISGYGPGLHAISVPDTSRESLLTIADLASSMRTQTASMSAMQLQMDGMLRTMRPEQLLTMSVPKSSTSGARVAQIFDDAPVGYVRGGVALDNETDLFFSPSDWERLITPLDQLGRVSGGAGAAGGVDTRPMVLLACAPDDYIHGGTYVDGRTPLWFHPTAATQVPGLGNGVGGRY